jgi:hypothetical protein
MMKRYRVFFCVLIVILVPWSSLVANAPQERPDLGELRKQIELFESVLNQSLKQAFGGPFDTLDGAQGAYLPGYGVVFSFEVNLSPVINMGPFNPVPTPKREAAQRAEELRRRDKAKAIADEVLANFGQTLSSLGPNESVAVIIHTAAAHPDKVERSTIVVSVDKKSIEERQANTIDRPQFARKLTTTEY